MAQFIKIINNQCTTLRHHKKKEINQVKVNHQRKHGQNSKAIEGQKRKEVEEQEEKENEDGDEE